jgi:hypothetical protein
VLTPGQSQDTIDAVTRQFGDRDWLWGQQEWTRDNTYANCWFTGEFESEELWKQYVSSGEGVAIQSTVRQLIRSFETSPGTISIQPVIYYDPDSGLVPPEIFHAPYYKHEKYRHEQEFRCFVVAPQSHGEYKEHPDGIGVWVPCNVQALTGLVRVAPNAPLGFDDSVRSLLRDGGLPTVRVEPSKVTPK